MFDGFIAKGGEIVHKVTLVELFANRMVERRNMIMSIYRGEPTLKVLGGVGFRRSAHFELFLWF
jgi:hypothetical protein